MVKKSHHVFSLPSALSPMIPYALSIVASSRRPYTFRTNHLIRAYAGHGDGPRRALSLVYAFRLHGLAPDPDSHCRGREVRALALKSGRDSEPFSQNRRVCVYSSFGDLERTVPLLEGMVKDGVDPNEATLISVLRKCEELSFGRKVHEVAMRSGLHREVKVANALLKMYAKCGCIDTARKVFDETSERNVFLWNSMIQGLVGHGQCREALELFLSMRDVEGVEPDGNTITIVLKACAQLGELSLGKAVHGVAKKNGLRRRTDVSNVLLDMYAKCGCIDNAREVFDEMLERDVVTWTAMIAGLVGHGRCQEALKLFLSMTDARVEPNEKTITIVLKACAQLGELSLGKEVHGVAKKNRLHRRTDVATALLDMYAKCGCIDTARKVFDETPERDVFMWNSMIQGLVGHGRCREALELFLNMRDAGVEHDQGTITRVLKACAQPGELSLVMEVHGVAKKIGLHQRTYVATALLDMYAKSGCIDAAREVFDEMLERNVVTWTAMIAGLVGHGRCQEALELFLSMTDARVELDREIITTVLKACAQLGELSLAREVHGVAKKNGLHRRTDVATALLDMYVKCGCIDAAREIFEEMPEKDVVSWNALIAGFVGHGRCQEALELFLSTIDARVKLDEMTIPTVLKACAQLGQLSLGKELHGVAKKTGLHQRTYVATALLDMYAKSGCIDAAREVFDEMSERDVVSWTAMIAGLVDHGRCQEALELFLRMRDIEGVEPNEKTIATVLKACAQLGELLLGREVHEIVKRSGLQQNGSIATALVDMYIKCGCIDAAREVFDGMMQRNRGAYKKFPLQRGLQKSNR